MAALPLDVDARPASAAPKSNADGSRGLSTPPPALNVTTGMQSVATDVTNVAPEISAVDDEVFIFPATAAQRRFWLLDQMTPGGNASLNMPLAIRLRGRLEVRVLERALNEIIARHEALRTVFHTENGKLCQLISPELTLRIPIIDPRDFPPAARDQVPDHLRREEAQTPFDLERGPLLRARLVRLQPEDHLLLITLHHIICDGWSVGVLCRELVALHGAFGQGNLSPLPEVPIQFADFAQWQQDVLKGGSLETQLAYWRRQLAGPLPVLDLPLDRPRRPERGVIPGGQCWRRLPDALAASLKTVAQKQGVTGFMLSLAAFAVLLHRYTGGQEDVLVSSPSAGRARSELESAIGLFVNPLLLRMNLAGNPAFGELLTRVRGTVLEAFANGDVPFETLLDEDLQPHRLQVNFLQQTAFMQPARSPDLEWMPMRAVADGAIIEWTAAVVEKDESGATQLFLEYNAGLYDCETIERVLAHFENLLAAIAAPGGLETPIGALSLLKADELRSLGASTASGEESKRAPALLGAWWRLPAESVGWVAAACGGGGPPASEDPALCGRLRDDVRLLVLDARWQPVPMGVIGEIFVAGLSDGAGLPAAQFVDDPGRANAKLFKTGDAGRWRADGDVEFLGRVDHQYTAHGARVALARVETALRTHPHICEAVVIPRHLSGPDIAGGKGLIAYVQTDGTLATALLPGTCRTFLRERFTEEMVPSIFTRIERFPLTPDGRLDESALPVPAAQPVAGADARPDGPFLTIHYQLIEIWQELLRVRSIGIRDDFFALGGNSLLAMRMLNRIEQNYGKSLLPSTLFKQATVEHLSEEIIRLDTTTSNGKPSPLLIIQADGKRTPIFYLHGDLTGGGYYCLKLSRRLGTDQPFYALPPVDVSTYREKMPSIEEMAALHVEAIRSARPHGPYVIGGFCLGGLIACEVAFQLKVAGETVERLLVIDAFAKEPRLRNLRRMAEWKGRLQGLDGEAQLYLFCRWHFFLARLDRWKGLGVRKQWEIAEGRLAGVWSRVRKFFSTNENTPSEGRASAPPPGVMDDDSTALLAADGNVASAPSSWFDPRWDVPLVFLWAAGGYRLKDYTGPMTLLLSNDLNDGADGKLVREWKRHVPGVQMRSLPGSHLACITEHVEELADTLNRVLEEGAR